MKIHITSRTVRDDVGKEYKMPDGKCRITKLPRGGKQRIQAKHLTGEFAQFVRVIEDGDAPRIVFDSHDGDITFKIDHLPGRYCLTCNERLPDPGPAGSEEEAKLAAQCIAHVKKHGGKAETSARWPHGYQSYPNAYACTVEVTELTKRLMRAGE
jgi:hypothetical protein